MFKEKIEQMKSLIVKGDDNKKKIENIAVFIVILVITIIVINIIWNGDEKSGSVNNQINGATLAQKEDIVQTSSTSQNELEQKLENILNKIEGVGNVKVMITYSQTSQTIAMYNEDNSESTTEENDKRRWSKNYK